jgi:uncharacterized damage-inducible protein DinB
MTAMISKQDLAALFKKETATTLKVLRAFPADQNDFKPHERASDILKLTSTFVFEMYLATAYFFGEEIDRSKFQTYKPENIGVVIEDFEKETTEVLRRMEAMDEADLAKTCEFGGRTFAADEFMLMMIHDQIHHRGQLTIYVRIAGGKVPSIYGPSSDDNSTNL